MSGAPRPTGLVLLAAGASDRLGTPKQLLPFRDRTLLRHATEQAVASGCHPIVVVLGAYADRLEPEVIYLPVRIARNAAWSAGMGSSIRTGLEALMGADPALAAVVIMVCDQPYCDAAVIRELVARHAGGAGRIVSAAYEGVYGVPALFDRELFPKLLALDGQEGARRLLEAHREEVVPVPFAPGGFDVDTPEDRERLDALSRA